jgi:PAS domain S-box-containing protein
MDDHPITDSAKIALLTRRITELEKVEAQEQLLQTTYAQMKQLYEHAPFGYQSLDENGCLLEVNHTWLEKLGYRREDAIGKKFSEFLRPEWQDHFNQYFPRHKALGEILGIEVEIVKKDKSTLLASFDGKIIKDADGHFLRTLCIFHDITERRRIRAYREMGKEILTILNDPIGLPDATQRIVHVLQEQTGFDAVGIRLQKGDDFPYLAQKGFPPNFLSTENSLIRRTPEGEFAYNQDGDIQLECTCGLVISGKSDPANPLFTPGGSFWVNDSSPLLDIPASEDPRCHPRNHCIHFGYASFALVPIRNQERIVGLIHLSDHRKGCFTRNSVEILEGIASLIGTALMRKQAEESLRAERKRLKDILGFLPDPTFAIDKEGRIIFWNKALEKMTGVAAEDIIGKGDLAYAVPFYGEARPQLIDLIFRDNEEVASLYPYILRESGTLATEVFAKALYNHDGAWVYAKASPLCDESGAIIGAIESIRDITENRRMADKLKKSIAWFKALFNATADSVILVKPDGMILDLNENAASRRNVCRGAMQGQNLFDFLPEESAIVRRRAIEMILNERTLVQYDETRDDKYYQIRLFPVMDHQGRVIQVACFSRDITESKQAAEEKKKLQAQLTQAQKMEAIGTLAGGIAHDFNNILGVIIGYAEIARDASPSGSIVVKNLNKVLEAGERAASLVKHILTFSRQTEIDRIPLEITRIVKDAVKFLRPSLPSTIAIKQHISTTTKPVLGNPTQIHQIIINLCANAFHAMEQTGGTLEIILKDCEFSRQDLRLQPDVQPGSFIELMVSDSGEGIHPEIRNRIFEPYFTTKGLGKGTGMGLAIVHGIVKSYGGFITCESELGKGAAFHVFFPALDQQETTKGKSVQAITGGKEHILLIDDEDILVEMAKSMLGKLGYRVTAHTSSPEALAAFQNQPDQFDLVITDQTMPDLTGSDLARQMLLIRPDLPIILCTGYSSIISEEEALSLGIKGFAFKPLTKKDLSTLIRKVLDARNKPAL